MNIYIYIYIYIFIHIYIYIYTANGDFNSLRARNTDVALPG